MPSIRIVDVVDGDSFALIPPCADPGFDHRTCDYWENAERGSKAARASWLTGADSATRPNLPADNPFAPPSHAVNPFAPARDADDNPFRKASTSAPSNPFSPATNALDENPFAPRREARPTVAADAPRKLQLLGRGLGVFGSYAKVLVADDQAVAYVQFGPLSAYPRAIRTRELYPQLPDSPLPAIVTCIATTADARRRGHAKRLVDAVCDDLAGRGFSAVEAYPERDAHLDATSAATVEFWLGLGFDVAVPDERYPVVRRELG